MIELSERELCALIRGIDGARRVVDTELRTKTITITKNEKGEVVDEDEDEEEEIEEGELGVISPDEAVVIAANVGGPFQAEIQRALMETLR